MFIVVRYCSCLLRALPDVFEPSSTKLKKNHKKNRNLVGLWKSKE